MTHSLFPSFMLVFALGQADSSCLPPVAPNPYAATIEMLKHPARTPPEFAQSARDSLAAAPADALPSILAAMHEQPLPVVNWLRSAGDDIVDRSLREGTALPHSNLADIAGNRALSPHPRRIALEWCERSQPGFAAEFLPDRLDDPVFAPDAVDATFQTALVREKATDTAGAQALLLAMGCRRSKPCSGRFADVVCRVFRLEFLTEVPLRRLYSL